MKFAWHIPLSLFVLLLLSIHGAYGQENPIALERPGDRDFVVDLAGIIDDGDEAQIRQLADKLLTDTAIPIIVVTIPSMAHYTNQAMSIEAFAELLFNNWGIGHVDSYVESSANRGMLLLVSIADRKARIELGATWGHDFDRVTQGIMDDQIIARFKRDDFSGGVLHGVLALESLARGENLPRPYVPPYYYLIAAAVAALAIFTIVSLIRRGMSGWAWVFWAAVFGLLGYVLYSMLVNSRSRGSFGGGFGGGSFGGGFSGGGGATGSW